MYYKIETNGFVFLANTLSRKCISDRQKMVGDFTTEMSIFGSLQSPKFCLNVYGRFVDSRLEQKLPNLTIDCMETFQKSTPFGS